MKWRNLGIVALAFLALGSYVYLYEIKGEKKREEASEKEKKLFQFEQKDIATLTIKPGNDEFVLQRDKDAWKLVKPIEGKADKSTADSVAIDLASAKTDRVIEEANTDWKKYGLAPPAVKLSAKLNDGKTYDLELGEKDFTDSSVFARVSGQNKVLVLPSSLLSSASKKLLDFRDKTVLEFQRDQIKEMSVASKDKEYRFEKSGEDWSIKAPFEARADRTEINSIISDLDFARVEEFVDSPNSNLKVYGLDKPEERVDLLLGDSRARKTLLVGKKVDSFYYAKDDSTPPVFKIKEDLYKKLSLDPQKIRDKKVIRFERADLTQIEVKAHDKLLSFYKGTDLKWKASKPDAQKDKPIIEYKIFWPIEDLEGRELIDNANLKDPKYGFSQPAAEVKLTDKNKKVTEIVLGKLDKEQVYVKTNAAPTVYKVDKKILDDLNFKIEDLLEKK
jgi:Domain of unknown function (DUF4340)